MKHLSLIIFYLSSTLRRTTVFGGQFNWGGCLQKRNGGAQRSAWSGWKSDCKCKCKSRLDCEDDHPSPRRFSRGSDIERHRKGAKAGISDPPTRSDGGRGLTDKSYPGDNRLVVSESSHRRNGSAP